MDNLKILFNDIEEFLNINTEKNKIKSFINTLRFDEILKESLNSTVTLEELFIQSYKQAIQPYIQIIQNNNSSRI